MSTVYNVITRYRTEGVAEAKRDAQALGSTVRQMAAVAKDSVFSMRGLFGAGVGAVGLTQLIRGITGLNSSLEQSRLSISTLLNVNRVYSFNDALVASRSIFRDLRADAAHGVGELSDYLGVYQQVISPALQAGGSLSQIRQLTKLTVAAGFALRGKEGGQLAGFDINQALTQGTGERTTPIVNQALRAAGITGEQFNAMNAQKRLTTLLEAFKAFAPAIDAQAKSWEGVSSTVRDMTKELFAKATQPLFAVWTRDLIKASDWLQRNEERVNHIADVVGRYLVAGWERGQVAVRNWRSELLRAIPVLTTIAGLQVAGQPGGLQALQAAGGGAISLTRRAGAGAAWLAAPVAAGAGRLGAAGRDLTAYMFGGLGGLVPMNHAQSLLEAAPKIDLRAPASSLTGLDNFGAAFASGVKVPGPLGIAGAGLGSLGAALKPLGAVAGKVAVPLAVVTSLLSAFTANTFGAANFLKGQAGGLLQEVKVTLGSIFAILDNGLFRSIGGVLLGALGGVVWAFKWLLKGLNALLVPLASAIQSIGIYFERGIGFILDLVKTRSLSQATANFWAGIGADMSELERRQRERFKLGAGTKPEDETAPPPNRVVPHTQVNIGKVEITQKVEQNGDPDRVAYAWSDMLSHINRYPRQSRAAVRPVR